MKRFLAIFFITFALIVGAVGAAPTAHAADGCVTAGNSCTLPDGSTGICKTNDEGITACSLTQAQGSPTPDPAAANTKTSLPPGPPDDSIFAKVMQWIMSLFAWLVGVAAITLDNAVYYTVVTMGTYIKDLSAIGVTWRILRDIGNIVIIFGFLAIGISTILNVNWYGGGFKMLPKLLVAAVFLNFSLFLSMAVIDAGNLFATQFYTQINGGNPAGAKNFDLVSVTNEGISNKIMGQLGLQTIYGSAITNPDVFKSGNAFIIGFMGSLVFLITAFVLFSLAFILIARFVILIFLIIIAPIGFAGLAIPQLKGTADKWWSTLFEQTITAPILLLLLYIALAVITDELFLKGFGIAEGLKTSDTFWTGFIADGNLTGFAGIMLSFLVAMGLLVAVVILSKKLSAFGGGMATSLAGKLSFGATAWAGRRTVGRASNFAARKIRSGAWGKGLQTSETGRLLAGTFDRGAKATYDARGVKKFGGLGGIGMGDVGKPAEGGYRKWEEEKVKVREAYAKGLKQTGREKNAQNAAEAQKKRAEEEIETIQNRYKPQIEEATEELRSANDALAQARAAGTSTTVAQAEVNRLKTARRAILDMQQTEIDPHKVATAVAQSEADTARTRPQVQYAERISGVPGGLFKHNRIAAENIKKEARKSKAEKDVDTLKEILERSSRTGGGGTKPPVATPPPAPAP
ncbi:MAG: hypothetical protein Q8L30_00280 [bacterium]|nr:hypothetical protein [bacterium]